MGSRQQRDVVAKVVLVVGLYQGAVPLVVRSLFDRDQRFAPALWLPAPWWWVACLAISTATVGLVLALHAGAPDEPGEPDGADGPDGPDERSTVSEPEPAASPAAFYDGLSAVVFLVGLYNGVAPFVARLVFDGDLLLAVTLRLPSPWWWLASAAVVIVAVALLEGIDRAKERAVRSGAARR